MLHELRSRCMKPSNEKNRTCIKIYFNKDDHQNLKLLSIDLNQMLLIGLVERTILVFKSSKSDVSLQSYGL